MISVSLHVVLKHHVQRRAAEGAFSSPSGYIGTLMREDRKRQAEAGLLEGLNSGPATPITAEDWAEIRAEVEARIAKRRQDSA